MSIMAYFLRPIASTFATFIIFLPLIFASSFVTRDPTAQLLSIVPSASSCVGATSPNECATAAQALDPILVAFSQYKVTSAPEQAALLSWIAFESGEFKYQRSHYPGTPGQGTRCMISPAFVKRYVASIPALASSAASTSDPAAMLDLVLSDQYSFASAAWFLTTQCSQEVRAQLQTGSDAGWEAFIQQCVQTSLTDARRAYWKKAVAALGVA